MTQVVDFKRLVNWLMDESEVHSFKALCAAALDPNYMSLVPMESDLLETLSEALYSPPYKPRQVNVEKRQSKDDEQEEPPKRHSKRAQNIIDTLQKILDRTDTTRRILEQGWERSRPLSKKLTFDSIVLGILSDETETLELDEDILMNAKRRLMRLYCHDAK